MNKINFVYKDLDPEKHLIVENLDSVDENFSLFKTGKDVWILQTYILLKLSGFSHLVLSTSFDKDAINVAHKTDIEDQEVANNFIICIRADRDPSFKANIEVVQNRYSIIKRNDYFIPHWPQPGLIPRDPSRGDKIENIYYFGKDCHLSERFKGSNFSKSLEEIGCKLIIQENEWNDYSQADLVLAVRDGRQFYLNFKPASKLVNSWLAKCVPILNYEEGYAELVESDLDCKFAKTEQSLRTHKSHQR